MSNAFIIANPIRIGGCSPGPYPYPLPLPRPLPLPYPLPPFGGVGPIRPL
jgi:hypothetical protein